MTVISPATFQSSVTLDREATLFAKGDMEITGLFNAANNSLFGDSAESVATFLASTMHRGPVFVEANMTIGAEGEAGVNHSLLVHSAATFSGDLAAVGGGSFGDEPTDAFAFLGSASFHADVSLGDGAGGLITADSDAVFRAPFSAVGTLVALGDNASTDRLEITAETHVLAGLLHAHGDSQVSGCRVRGGVGVSRF